MADDKDETLDGHDPHFEPIVQLPPVETKTLEEDEEEIFRMRSKLFRYDSQSDPPEWKERGLGDIKILRHKDQGLCRLLMRREKTLKICCNHYVPENARLMPNCNSEKAFVWSTPADFADEEARPELLAIRFSNAENAQKFKEKFEEAQKAMTEWKTKDNKDDEEKKGSEKKEENTDEKEISNAKADEVAEKLEGLSVKEDKKEEKDVEEKSTEQTKETEAS